MGIRVGEESITDRLLLDLARAFPHPTRIVKWNRIEEGRKTGADWDWWFVEPWSGRGVGLRVQAKRVDYFNGRMTGLDAQNRNGWQRAMLQLSAAEAGMHPLYCFYVASTVPRSGATACGSFVSDEAPSAWAGSNELYGCSIVGPEVVETAVQMGDQSLGFFWPLLLPWSCLACCEKIGGSLVDLADRQATRVGSMRADIEAAAIRSPEPRSLITESLPPEVIAVAGGEGFDDVGMEPPDVGATVVTLVRSPDSEG
jgi:hypothetical protein